MICTSIQGRSYEDILALIDSAGPEMLEIRMDSCPLSDEQISLLFGETEIPLVATCRISGSISADIADHRLSLAIQAGAGFADLELEAPAPVSHHIQKLCREYGTQLIRSYHNFSDTPDAGYLDQVLDRCRRYGASIAKIVTTSRSESDTVRLFELYDKMPPGHLIAFCMGESGRSSRLECLRRGAPFTYACLSEDEATAPGQWTTSDISIALYGNRKSYVRRSLTMPSSKSFAQRAIIAAALSEGVSHLGNFSPCEDSLSAIRVARALGAEVSEGRTLAIKGIGPVSEPLHLERLNTGESGLLTRLMIPLMSQLNEGSVTVEGEKTLLERPLNGASDIMAAFGVMVSSEDPTRGKTVFVPAKVRGKLVPGVADIPGKGGSQLISGLLMSLPLCAKPSTIFVGEPRSIPYMFITVDLLKHFGVVMESEMEGGGKMIEQQDWSDCTGITFRIKGNQRYKAADFDLEGDWSAAANYLVAGAIFGLAEIDNLDCSSLQADLAVMNILVEAGASVSQTEDGKVCVCKAPLEAFETDLNNAPDLFPIVSVLAAFSSGRSTIAGVGRLRAKESDRAAAILEMLSGMGVPAGIDGDTMWIEGEGLSARIAGGRLLKGGSYTSRHDHRMVMALKVASLGADTPIEIDDEACVAKSFPEFKL